MRGSGRTSVCSSEHAGRQQQRSDTIIEAVAASERHVKLYLYEVAAVFVLQLIIESRRTRVESLSFLPNSLSTDSDKGHSLGHQGRRGAPLTKLVHRLFGSKARPR